MDDKDVKILRTELLFPWCPEVEGGHVIETSASPQVAMRLEYVVLLDGWKLEGLDVGGHSYRITDPDLRALQLPLVHIVFRVTLRARNTSAEKQRFPGAKIIGTVVL